MGIFNLFRRKPTAKEAGWRVGGMEDFMTLIRVYYQATMAANLGISNLAAMPDLRVFKQTLHIPTQNNRLGLGEKKHCRRMLGEIYGLSDGFFAEIDASVRRGVRNVNDMRTYLYQFQGFSQELMMLMGNLMKWKFRLPSFMRKMLRALTEQTMRQIMTKTAWNDAGVAKAAASVRRYSHALGYSEAWMSEYVYSILLLAKKEPQPADDGKKD